MLCSGVSEDPSPEAGKEAGCKDPQEHVFRLPGMGSFTQHVIY